MADIEAEIAKFTALTNPGKFPGIPRILVAHGLRARLKEPSLINQGDASLCGPASLMYHIASEDPETYAHYVMNLYDAGVGYLGRTKVKPSAACRNYTPNPAQIPAVDWIALASLRDSENEIRNYDDVSDQIPGITDPEMLAKWYRKAGWKYADEFADWNWRPSLARLIDCDYWFAKGHLVSLFTKGTLINGPGEWELAFDSKHNIASHWAPLVSRIRIDSSQASDFRDEEDSANNREDLRSDLCEFDVFSWGRIHTVSLPTSTVLTYFHGAVIT